MSEKGHDFLYKLLQHGLLHEAELDERGERADGLVDDELVQVTQSLLDERLQDGRALPAHVRCHAHNVVKERRS